MAEKPKRKMNLSPEERLRRSEQAKKQVAEGKIGGARKGAGRPTKKRAQEEVAERIRGEANAIFNALRDGLKAESNQTRLKAALAMIEIENKEVEHQAKEEQRIYDNLDRAALLALIEEKFSTLEKAGVLGKDDHRLPMKVEAQDVEVDG